MKCIHSSPGHTTVSIDLAAGEPSVTAHFSQDVNYRYATFDGVGKEPEYRNGILMLDDIYLMTMSVSPIGKERIRETFDTYDVGNVSFVKQWMRDAEVLKKYLKAERNFHKMLCLALGYGMGPKKMVTQSRDQGHTIDLETARLFYRAYWDLFSGVRRFADRLAARVKKDGYIVNPFGYRLTPPPFKAFNYFIQSSVSGIMHIFCMKLFAVAPYARFISVIHDEVLAEVPLDRLEDFRVHAKQATDSLNEDLKWSIAIRTGFAPGLTWYEAK